MIKYIIAVAVCLMSSAAYGQVSSGENKGLNPYTAQTGGTMTPLQAAYDVTFYGLNLTLDPTAQSIKGFATMKANALSNLDIIEMDLDPRYNVTEIYVWGLKRHPVMITNFEKKNGKLLIPLPDSISADTAFETTVAYDGTPHVAENAPWDGGFVWAKTPSGKDWIATAVQGNGCDLIFPCKDHVADKTDDGVDMEITVPKGLKVAMAGVLTEVTEGDTHDTFLWQTKKPLSPYHIAINVGPFKRLQYSYTSVNGTTVPVEFWALQENEAKARNLVESDLMQQIAYFENRLGPYPWGDEKVGMVETPHLGMEHQTMNAYGNRYRSDWRDYDWLLHHEFAHEWWGNMLTQKQSKDFWLHEGTGTYMQPDYAGFLGGEEKYMEYMDNIYAQIQNCAPIVPEGDPKDHELGAGNDTYYKGAWMLHTLRKKVGDEVFWNAITRALYQRTDTKNISYPIAPVMRGTDEFIALFNQEAGEDLSWIFDVYLREGAPLKLDVKKGSYGKIKLAWNVPGGRPFSLAVPVKVGDKMISVPMKKGKGSFKPKGESYEIDPNRSILMHREGVGQVCESGPVVIHSD